MPQNLPFIWQSEVSSTWRGKLFIPFISIRVSNLSSAYPRCQLSLSWAQSQCLHTLQSADPAWVPRPKEVSRQRFYKLFFFYLITPTVFTIMTALLFHSLALLHEYWPMTTIQFQVFKFFICVDDMRPISVILLFVIAITNLQLQITDLTVFQLERDDLKHFEVHLIVLYWQVQACKCASDYLRSPLFIFFSPLPTHFLVKFYLSKEVAVSSGAVGESGSPAQPTAVWDDDVVHVREERVPFGDDHGVQTVRASLLHALYDELDIHGQVLVWGWGCVTSQKSRRLKNYKRRKK